MKLNIKYNAPVVLTFAIVCAVTLLVNYLTGGASNALLFITRRSSPTDPLTYLRLFTHVLGHATWDHYAGNMMLFLLLGPMLEEKYGSRTLLFVLVTTALVTALTNTLVSTTGLLGASSLVFAFIILSSMTSFTAGELPLTLLLVALLYLGREVADGLFTRDNISQLSHIVGGLSGGACGYLVALKSRRS